MFCLEIPILAAKNTARDVQTSHLVLETVPWFNSKMYLVSLLWLF